MALSKLAIGLIAATASVGAIGAITTGVIISRNNALTNIDQENSDSNNDLDEKDKSNRSKETRSEMNETSMKMNNSRNKRMDQSEADNVNQAIDEKTKSAVTADNETEPVTETTLVTSMGANMRTQQPAITNQQPNAVKEDGESGSHTVIEEIGVSDSNQDNQALTVISHETTTQGSNQENKGESQ